MAYKFQLGAARLSGSLTQEGAVTAESSTISGSSITLPDGGLTLNETAVSATAAELNLIDGSSAGTVVNSKAVIYSSAGAVNGTHLSASLGITGSSLTLAGTAVTATATELNLLDNITRGSILVGGSGGSAELDAKTDGRILVGDGTDLASVAVSGDATLANNGAVTLAAAQTNITSLLATDIKIGEDDQTKIDFEDANKINFYANNAKELVLEENKLTPGANDGIALGDSSLGFSDLYLADGAEIQFGNDQDFALVWSSAAMLTLSGAADEFTFQIKGEDDGANGVVLNLMASSSSPADNDVIATVDFAGFSDGGTATTYGQIKGSIVDASQGATQGKLEFLVAEFDGTATAGISIEGKNENGEVDVSLGAGTGSVVTVAGDLIVNGTTTTINSTSIEITGSFVFEGADVDNNETTLNVISPSADRTISLPDQDGVVPVLSPSLSDSELATAITAAPSEINLLAAGTAIAAAVGDLADEDGFIVEDGNTMKKVQLSSLSTYIGAGSLSVQNIDDSGTITAGLNYFSALGGAESCTLPASPSVGDTVYVKAPSNCSSTNTITINRAGSHTIDGVTAIVLESPHAAVTLIYAVANTWVIV